MIVTISKIGYFNIAIGTFQNYDFFYRVRQHNKQ